MPQHSKRVCAAEGQRTRRRLDKAKREIALASDYDYLVINRDGKAAEAAGTVQSVVAAERCRRMKDRIADIFFAQNK